MALPTTPTDTCRATSPRMSLASASVICRESGPSNIARVRRSRVSAAAWRNFSDFAVIAGSPHSAMVLNCGGLLTNRFKLMRFILAKQEQGAHNHKLGQRHSASHGRLQTDNVNVNMPKKHKSPPDGELCLCANASTLHCMFNRVHS